MQRSGKLKLVACYSRSAGKRKNFADKYGCRAAESYAALLADPEIEAVINTHAKRCASVDVLCRGSSRQAPIPG